MSSLARATSQAAARSRSTNAGTLLADDLLQLLRIIAARGPIPMARLRELDPTPSKKLHATRQSTSTRVTHLRTERLVKAFKPTPRDAVVVEITTAGRQALQAVDGVPAAAPAPAPAPAVVVDLEVRRLARADSRWRPSYPLYDGSELRPFTGRPGALDAFALPSLVGGERLPRTRAPILNASTKPDRLLDGRGRR